MRDLLVQIIMTLSGLVIVAHSLERVETFRSRWRPARSIGRLVSNVACTLAWAMIAVAGGGIAVHPFLDMPSWIVARQPIELTLMALGVATIFVVDWTRHDAK